MTHINPKHLNFVISDLNATVNSASINSEHVIINAEMESPVNKGLMLDFDVCVVFETFASGKGVHALGSELISVKGSIAQSTDEDVAQAEAELFASQLEEHDLSLLFNHSNFIITAIYPGGDDEYYLTEVVLPNDPHSALLDIDNDVIKEVKISALEELHESMGLPSLHC